MQNKSHIVTGTDHHQVMEFLEDRIYEHNSQQLKKEDGDLFSMIIRSDGNDMIAGVAGWTWANACEITQLWVDPSFRKHGLGRLLLEAAEKQANAKGCQTILVRSYDFQAPAFYLRHGYRTEHIINGFPPGHRCPKTNPYLDRLSLIFSCISRLMVSSKECTRPADVLKRPCRAWLMRRDCLRNRRHTEQALR